MFFKLKKKHRLILAAMLIVLSVIVLGGAVPASADSPEKEDTVSEQSKFITSKDPEENGKIGNFIVTIKEFNVTTDFEGDKVLVITYNFTNNSKNPSSFLYSLDAKCYQNGVELGEVFTSYGIEDFSFDNMLKDVKKGVTLEVQDAYKLNDDTSDVDVEISKLISFKNDVLEYQIKIAQ